MSATHTSGRPQASVVEIYNEAIFDLLSESPRETSSKLEVKESGCVQAAPAATLPRPPSPVGPPSDARHSPTPLIPCCKRLAMCAWHHGLQGLSTCGCCAECDPGAVRASDHQCYVRARRRGHMWVPGLLMSAVASVDDVEALLARADKGRSTFATDMNEHSSRSHLILSLYVRSDHRLSGERTASKLHLIDLAGSERVSRSNAEGQRLKEAQNINTSLSALGDVIQSLRAQVDVPLGGCAYTPVGSEWCLWVE